MKRRILSCLLILVVTLSIFPQIAFAETHSGECTEDISWSFNTDIGELLFSGTGALTMDYGYRNESPWYKYRDAITSVTIGEGITSIGENALYGCTSAKNLSLSSTVTDINEYVYNYPNCNNLSSIYVSAANSVFSSSDGVLFDKNGSTLLHYPESKSGDYSIPSTVYTIAEGAFRNSYNLTNIYIPNTITKINPQEFWECRNLQSINLPDSIVSIGDLAFGCCVKLSEVYIPYSVTSVGYMAFGAECFNLQKIDVSENNQYYCSEDGILFNKSKTEIICYPSAKAGSDYAIPSTVTTIKEGAFQSCKYLSNISIPNSVLNIERYAFNCCSLLDNVVIPDSVLSLGEGAFQACTALTKINLPKNITEIGFNTFSECTSLMTISIPNSVTSVGLSAFFACEALTDVYYLGNNEEWNSITINDNNESLLSATIHFGTMDSIKKADTNLLSLTIYENKNDSYKVNDLYRLSKGATVSNSVSSEITTKTGKVKIENNKSDITISKKGYVTRTITTERAKRLKKVHLQQDIGVKPIIQAVWLGNTDVYTTKYEIDLTSTDEITLEAEIYWKNGTQNNIYLMQETRKVNFTGTTLTTVLSDNFDVSETIYIVAEDTDGNATKKKLKIDVPDVYNDMEIKIGDKTKGTLPDSIPFIGGKEVELDVPFIPLTVTYEDSKFYAVVGIDVVKATEEYGYDESKVDGGKAYTDKKTKYFFENVKETYKKNVEKCDINELTKKFKNALNHSAATVGFEADVKVLGYLEGYIDSSGNVILLDGGIGINPSVKAGMSSQLWYLPPIFWESEIKGEIEAMTSLYQNNTAKNFSPNGTMSGKLALKAGVGVGVTKAIGAVGGGKGALEVNWDMYANRDDYFSIEGELSGYTKVFIGPIELLNEEYKFVEGLIWDYPSTRVKSRSAINSINFYDTSDYSLIDRSYIENKSYFVANETSVMPFSLDSQNKEEQILKTNVYTYSEPQLAEFYDGTMIAIWLDDDTAREDVNRTALHYSFYDGTMWSEPVQIDNDGTGDYSPNIKIFGDIAYITWVNAKSPLENNADISEMFNTWEIDVIQFDKERKTFSEKSIITNDNSIDMSPIIYGNINNINVAWIKNLSNDILSETNSYQIMTSRFKNSIWSEETVYTENLMPIDSFDACIFNDDTYIAYSVDTDGNQADYTDKEIYLNNVRLTDNDVLDSKPIFVNNKLYYYSNGKIIEHNLYYNYEQTIIESIPTDRFNIITDGQNYALVYGKEDALVTEINAILYDYSSGEWSKSIALTQLESSISSYSGVFSQDGTLKFVINKTELTDDATNPYGQTDIALFTVTPTYDLSLGEVVYHEETLLAGNTIELNAEITNNGELWVNGYMIQIADEDANILATTYSKKSISPGETTTFTAYYPLDESEFTPHNIAISVVPTDVDDFNINDNSTNLYLTYSNIALENLDYGIDETGNAIIYADIVNRGYTVPEDITATLHKDGVDGEIVQTITVDETLSTLELSTITFEVPFKEDTIYYVTIDKEGQNSDFVVLSSKVENEIYYDTSTNKCIVSSNIEVPTATLIVASYKEGRLLALQSKTIAINRGDNSYDSPLTDFNGADTIKVFVWENMSNIKPLFKSYILEIE